jgi:hypothetical protein
MHYLFFCAIFATKHHGLPCTLRSAVRHGEADTPQYAQSVCAWNTGCIAMLKVLDEETAM